MKGVQCYELFGGIALEIHTFSFHFSISSYIVNSSIFLSRIEEIFSFNLAIICILFGKVVFVSCYLLRYMADEATL